MFVFFALSLLLYVWCSCSCGSANLRGRGCCHFCYSLLCTWCNFPLIPLYISKNRTNQWTVSASGFEDFFSFHWTTEWVTITKTDVPGINEHWNLVIESTVCLMDVVCVTDVLPAAVGINFEHVSSAAVMILALLLATPFSENSTRITCLI